MLANISEKALLVSIHVSKWTASVKDRKVTNEVHNQHNCKGNAGRFIKQLIDKNDGAYKEIQAISNEIQAYRQAKTLPWLEDGIRILPSNLYVEFAEHMRDFRTRYDHAVMQFQREYESIKNKAKVSLNGLYKEEDYPNNIGGKFGVEIRYLPFPDQQDFRVSLSVQETDLLKSHLQREVNESVNLMVQDLYERLRVCLGRIADKLKDQDAIFRDSLIGNLREACRAVGELNITDNQHLADLNREIQATLASIEPQQLRNDKVQRQVIQAKADEILRKMEGF